MKLRINGEEQTLAEPVSSVAQLLEHLGVPCLRTAVELNGAIVDQQLFEQTPINDDDRIEIVSFAGGG